MNSTSKFIISCLGLRCHRLIGTTAFRYSLYKSWTPGITTPVVSVKTRLYCTKPPTTPEQPEKVPEEKISKSNHLEEQFRRLTPELMRQYPDLDLKGNMGFLIQRSLEYSWEDVKKAFPDQYVRPLRRTFLVRFHSRSKMLKVFTEDNCHINGQKIPMFIKLESNLRELSGTLPGFSVERGRMTTNDVKEIFPNAFTIWKESGVYVVKFASKEEMYKAINENSQTEIPKEQLMKRVNLNESNEESKISKEAEKSKLKVKPKKTVKSEKAEKSEKADSSGKVENSAEKLKKAEDSEEAEKSKEKVKPKAAVKSEKAEKSKKAVKMTKEDGKKIGRKSPEEMDKAMIEMLLERKLETVDDKADKEEIPELNVGKGRPSSERLQGENLTAIGNEEEKDLEKNRGNNGEEKNLEKNRGNKRTREKPVEGNISDDKPKKDTIRRTKKTQDIDYAAKQNRQNRTRFGEKGEDTSVASQTKGDFVGDRGSTSKELHFLELIGHQSLGIFKQETLRAQLHIYSMRKSMTATEEDLRQVFPEAERIYVDKARRFALVQLKTEGAVLKAMGSRDKYVIGGFPHMLMRYNEEPPRELSFFDRLEKDEFEYAHTKPHVSGFDEQIQLTKEGKAWKFPIDNEQEMEHEKNVSFAEHIFLDEEIESFPNVPSIRHFMELVCVGLSKNAFMTVKEKRDHIEWYRQYFSDKVSHFDDVYEDEEIQQEQ